MIYACISRFHLIAEIDIRLLSSSSPQGASTRTMPKVQVQVQVPVQQVCGSDVVLKARPWPRGQIFGPWPWLRDLWLWPSSRRSQDVCPSVRLSVCLSHAGILSNRLNVSSNFFSASGSYAFLILPYQRYGNTPMGTPLTGASNARRNENNRYLRAISLSRK